MNIAVLCSGNGTNLQAIIDACEEKIIDGATIKVVVADKQEAYALVRAKNHGIESLYLNPKEYSTRAEYDQKIVDELTQRDIELVVLAGFMRILSDNFVFAYRNKILNIHPALLPSFKGAHSIKDAIDAGVKITGVTVHFVDETLDSGPIILQESVSVLDNDIEETLAERIHAVEHKLYPQAIELFVKGKLVIEGRIVKINTP